MLPWAEEEDAAVPVEDPHELPRKSELFFGLQSFGTWPKVLTFFKTGSPLAAKRSVGAVLLVDSDLLDDSFSAVSITLIKSSKSLAVIVDNSYKIRPVSDQSHTHTFDFGRKSCQETGMIEGFNLKARF